MEQLKWIGEISLNVSLLLYLTNYLPQLWHNRKNDALREMSLLFHGLLLLCYATDLVYAIGYQMPFQYLLVSIVGCAALGYQHWQLTRLRAHDSRLYMIIFAVMLVLVWGVVSQRYVLLEYISQAAGFAYFAPQFIKNLQLASVNALSSMFLVLSLSCTLCDNLSAWFLAWPMPNKIGSGVRLILGGVMLVQWLYYHRQHFKALNGERYVA